MNSTVENTNIFKFGGAIGRKYFFINLIILLILLLPSYLLSNFFILVLQNLLGIVHHTKVNWVAIYFSIFMLFIWGLFFISLLEKRVYDILGKKPKGFFIIMLILLLATNGNVLVLFLTSTLIFSVILIFIPGKLTFVLNPPQKIEEESSKLLKEGLLNIIMDAFQSKQKK